MTENNLRQPKPEMATEDFVNAHQDNIVKRAGRVLGGSVAMAGTALSLTGMIDAVSGNDASRWLMQIETSQLPSLVGWALEQSAALPFISKLSFGSTASILGAGLWLALNGKKRK